jgi:hypothetical protein
MRIRRSQRTSSLTSHRATPPGGSCLPEMRVPRHAPTPETSAAQWHEVSRSRLERSLRRAILRSRPSEQQQAARREDERDSIATRLDDDTVGQPVLRRTGRHVVRRTRVHIARAGADPTPPAPARVHVPGVPRARLRAGRADGQVEKRIGTAPAIPTSPQKSPDTFAPPARPPQSSPSKESHRTVVQPPRQSPNCASRAKQCVRLIWRTPQKASGGLRHVAAKRGCTAPSVADAPHSPRDREGKTPLSPCAHWCAQGHPGAHADRTRRNSGQTNLPSPVLGGGAAAPAICTESRGVGAFQAASYRRPARS